MKPSPATRAFIRRMLRPPAGRCGAVLGAGVLAAVLGAGPALAAPRVAPGAVTVSVSPVNRQGLATTVFTLDFTDSAAVGVDGLRVTFEIREPDDVTELVLVDDRHHGSGGLVLADLGGGSFRASYVYEPVDGQTLGLYDLYGEITDGVETAVDGYENNPDELEIVEEIPNRPPAVEAGAAKSSVAVVNRAAGDSTVLSAAFSDLDYPPVTAFAVTFRVREPDHAAELVLADGVGHGAGGVTIVENGGSYIARFTWTPGPAQALGAYDLYFEVSDGAAAAVDGYADNLDELEIADVLVNRSPVVATGAATVSPAGVRRAGALTTEFRVDFTDADQPAAGAFQVTFRARRPYHAGIVTVADALPTGTGGMLVTDLGGGSYTARCAWDPPEDALVGSYDLEAVVSDGADETTDFFADNLGELEITADGENARPVVAADETWASPAGVERTGAALTTVSADFADADAPGVGAFTVTVKLRAPDHATELVLADGVGHGAGGVTITDLGGGVYRGSVSWDPPDLQETGFYDLFFAVSDGSGTSTDGFADNLDELEVYDAISNHPPALTAGTAAALPDSITRIGADHTMLQAVFSDADLPGIGAFTVTFKVRDPAAGETLVVDAGVHGAQGLRVVQQGGGTYRAAVLWDPPAGQVTGAYDLYFSVVDNRGGAAVDDYANNLDELTVTAAAPAGDGYLLHRSAGAASCGGPDAACHDLEDHQGQDCRVCHAPHGSTNLYLVPETIETPNSGSRAVEFKTLGIGDPYNDPDPVPGDPAAGSMADDSDGVHAGVCEVCHTATAHHRNDGSAPGAGHYNAEICTDCHAHERGFAGGESEGGIGCACHREIFHPLNTSTGSYHHMLSSDLPDYTIASRTCLMCHVDHDIFRPDLNPGFGARARNLRADLATSVVQGSAATLANTDYTSAGTGGICLSCHTSTQTKAYPQPDGTTETPAIVKADYDAATSAHNYDVPATFSADGSTFEGNCVKCHSDGRTRLYQNSTVTFSLHDSDYRLMLDPQAVPAPADPLEEAFCYGCHSATANPNAASNLDLFGEKAMTDGALAVGATLGYTYAHPTEAYSGRHQPVEGAAELADGNRHAECADCHNPHAARQGTHDGSSNLVSNALKGTWGVEPAAWPAAPTPSDNGNVFAAPASFNRVEPALREFQICLKCHSNYTTLPSGRRNLAEEINPNYPSTHGIVQESANPYCDSNTMNEPWGTSGVAWCSDCHRSADDTDPAGPHGSNQEHLLVAPLTSSNVAGTPFCYICHKETVYFSSLTAVEWSGCRQHPSRERAHRNGLQKGCFACHFWDYSSRAGVGVNTVNSLSAGEIFIHGQNKRWVFNEANTDTGYGGPVKAFLNGYIGNAETTWRTCWTEGCHIEAENWQIGLNR